MTMRLPEYQQAARQDTQPDRATPNTVGPAQGGQETAADQVTRANEATPTNEQVRMNEYDAAMGNRIDIFA